jgi:hypothetical protein
VLIYFDLASKRRVVHHFYSSLLPGDYVFLGQTESLFQVDDSFRLVYFPGTTAYWKPTAAQAGGAQIMSLRKLHLCGELSSAKKNALSG